MRFLLLTCAAMIGLGGCVTTPRSCRALASDLPLVEVEHASVAQLQCASDRGVAAAQVLLGKRHEAGEGVPRDLARAAALYERAAASVPPTTAIYSPPVRPGGRGQMLFLSNPNAGPGSAEAQYRLGRLLLSGSGIEADPRRGRALITRAAAQNYAPAIAELRRLSE